MSRISILIIFIFYFLAPGLKAQPGKEHPDSILLYKNGKDSVRFIYKKDRVFKELYYFPSGQKQQQITNVKEYKKGDYHQWKSKYITWDEKGKTIERSRQNIEKKGAAKRYHSWTFKKNGRCCLRKEGHGWGTKN
ncbi:MAG: hypothetical protein ACJ77K_10600 [Bacteroidia bacterium]